MTDYEDLQKRCQRGVTNLNDANNLLAECYGMLGKLGAENSVLKEEVGLDDKLIAERDRLLNLFACPDHGQCVPYAMEQVEALRKDAERFDKLRAVTLKQLDGDTEEDFNKEFDIQIAKAMGKEG